MVSSISHVPVMLNEVIASLVPQEGKIYVDCTFGAGGYSQRILETANCKVIAIDQDPSVEQYAKPLIDKFSPQKFIFVNRNFEEIEDILYQQNITKIDGIVFDLGVSSMQLDQAERGFSFNKNARLDMRMGNDGIDAWEVVNKYSEEDLADIIYYYGEERFSRNIARNIVAARKVKSIDTTIELADIVKKSVKSKTKLDPATKTFQAIRVYVNDELKVLKRTLTAAYNLLNLNGKLVIVSFQGLEDKIIKDFIKLIPGARAKSIKPTSEEIRANIRSRSAKLRLVIRQNDLMKGDNK